MDINERIESEEKRHMGRINELSEILKMYKNDARDYLVSTEGKVNQAINYDINPDKIVSYEESRQNINPYEKQIKETQEEIRKENELHEKNMIELNNQKNVNDKGQEVLDEISLQLDEGQQELYNEEDLTDTLGAERDLMEEIVKKVNQDIELTLHDLEEIYNVDEYYMLSHDGFDMFREIAKMKQEIRKKRDCISDLNKLFDTIWKKIPNEYTLRLDYLTSVEGLKLPEIEGNLALNGLTTAKGLVLPKQIGGNLELEGLTSTESLVLPEKIGGKLYTKNLNNEKEDIRNQMQQAQEQLAQTLEWAKQQPNKPTMTYTGNLETLPSDVNEKIMQSMESKGEVIISEINKVYQDGNYIVIDAKDNQGRYTGTEFTLDEFVKMVNEHQNKSKKEKINQVINSMDPKDLQYAPLPDIKKHLTETPNDELNDMLDDYDQSMEESNKEEVYEGPEQDKPKVLVYKKEDNKTGGFGNVLIFSLIAAIGIAIGLIVLIISR